MTDYKRPWWLIVNKSNTLTTTVHEDAQLGERTFLVKGTPMVQGLSWLVWGPVVVLLAVAVLVGLAIILDVQQQGWAVKGVLIMAFLLSPILLWVGVALILNHFSKKPLQRERQAATEECIIRLDQKQGILFYQTTQHPTEEEIPYARIRRIRVSPSIGSQDISAMRLVLETDEGPIVLLNQNLGTTAQKNDLAREIEEMLADYADKQKAPPA